MSAIRKASSTLPEVSNTFNRAFTVEPKPGDIHDVVVGMSDMKVMADTGCRLVTHYLGSCIGVAMWDQTAGIGGMIHFQLPDSSQSQGKQGKNPFMFADTGISALFGEMLRFNASRARLVTKICGGASFLDPNGFFNIGKRNHTAARKTLWRLGCLVAAEDVGGDYWRTMTLCVATGDVRVKTAVVERVL